MSRHVLIILVLAVGALLSQVGCSGQPSRIAAADLDPDSAADEALKLHDKNGDGQIDADEQAGCPGLAASLSEIDTNKDGKFSRDEIAARLTVYVESRVGLIGNMTCKITQRGSPVADADVRLVPEKFLGDGIETAEGRTGATGYASLAIPGQTLPGVRPGLYRVEVSKKDASGQEQIPAEFNTQTRLGMEANNVQRAEPKMTFEFALDKRPQKK